MNNVFFYSIVTEFETSYTAERDHIVIFLASHIPCHFGHEMVNNILIMILCL
jgi:hypothetical protein